MSDDGEDEYGGEYEDLNDDLDPTEDIKFPLFQHQNAPAAAAQGEVKAYHVKEDGNEIYAKQESDYSITVQRLLWVDGLEKTHEWTTDRKTGQHVKKEVARESTLVVLKILLCSFNPDEKFQWMTTTLALEDAKPGGKDHPQLQAWAPWRKLDRRNEIVAHREKMERVEAGAKVGYQGVEISAGTSREGKISWDQTFFDEGHSAEVITDGKRNGVTWFGKQNRLDDQGVKREVWVSALFSRSSSAPYLVKFNIYAHAGKLSEFAQNTKKFFGLGDGETKAFSITPGKNQICKDEGTYIRECIDISDLGKLRDKELSSNLVVAWGPDHQNPSHTAPGIKAERAPEDSGTGPKRTSELAAEKSDSTAMAEAHSRNKAMLKVVSDGELPPNPPLAATPTPGRAQMQAAMQFGQSGPSGLLPGDWYNRASTATVNTDYARLVALEGRAAHSEARIADQDMLILQLQRELMAKDVQLAKMQQALEQLAHGCQR
jgi:hypothetical protein